MGIFQAYKDTYSKMRGSDVFMATAVGVTAVVAAPQVLPAVGFGVKGVAAGSIAAAVQTPVTHAGGYFALSQSAGVLGLSGMTKLAVGAVVGGVTYVSKKAFSWMKW